MRCRKHPFYLKNHQTVFPGYGPALTLFQEVSRSPHPYLIRALAGFIVLQWKQMKWPMPDGVIPLLKGVFVKKKPVYLLAKELAKQLQSSFHPFFKSIEILWEKEEKHTFSMTKKIPQGEIFLLLDDLLSSEKLLQKAHHCIQRQLGCHVYSLALIEGRF